ncbi:hypothetical protein [Staphylococcus hominis]|uniref:hypothetical protein n=1 Tax=Staphylococcus hominis TaxID=1290 RepID=UPI003204BB96
MVDKIKKGYLFERFDFEEFRKDKHFAFVSAEEKKRFDQATRKMTDEHLGVNVTVSIAIDKYNYATDKSSDEKQIGLNENVRFTVFVEGGNLDDFEDFKTNGLEAPKEVEIYDVNDVIYRTYNNDNTLTVNAKVRIKGNNAPSNKHDFNAK